MKSFNTRKSRLWTLVPVTVVGLVGCFSPTPPVPVTGGASASPSSGPTASTAPTANPTPAATVSPAPTPTPAAAPNVVLVFPADASAHIGVNDAITITFDGPMNPATMTSSFTLTQNGNPVAGTVTTDQSSATFTPTVAMIPNSAFTATVTTGAKNAGGTALIANRIWTFTTGEKSVALGVAGTFAVLAGSAVTNTGPTTLNGNMGTYPGSSVGGFPPGLLNGSQHVASGTSGQGEFDLTVAYNDAAGRTHAPISRIGNLGGLTLIPGLYKSTGVMEISSGDLTLDAQGEANAVFIFQIAETLITTAGRQVFLIGGAKAANVFWQVGTSATFGTTSAFKGTVMADQAITLENGATLEGRALARIAGVALESNTITIPAQ